MIEDKGILKIGLEGTPLDGEHTHNVNLTVWEQENNNLNHIDYACYSVQWFYTQKEHKMIKFCCSLVGLTSHVPLIWASCCAIRV